MVINVISFVWLIFYMTVWLIFCTWLIYDRYYLTEVYITIPMQFSFFNRFLCSVWYSFFTFFRPYRYNFSLFDLKFRLFLLYILTFPVKWFYCVIWLPIFHLIVFSKIYLFRFMLSWLYPLFVQTLISTTEVVRRESFCLGHLFFSRFYILSSCGNWLT